MPYFTKKGTGKNKGKTCVYKKEDGTKVGCTDGPVEKYLAALHIHESKDFDWLSGPLQIRFGDIKDNLKDYISYGDTIYLSGTLQMVDNGEDLNSDNSIQLDMEPVIVKVPFYTNGNGLEVVFGENITDKPLWSDNASDDWLDLGGFQSDYDLLITIPEKNNINESEEDDLNWIKNIGGEIEDFVLELRNLIKEHVPVADLELDWDTTTNDGEYFGKVWLYDRFYELYKYDKFFKIIFYYLDPETDRYEVYEQYENLPKTRLLTLLLNDMINVSRQNLNESKENNDFNWVELTNPTLQQYFDSQTLNLGDKLWLRGNADNEEGDGEIYVDGIFTITGGVNKKYLNGVAFDTTDDIKELLGIDADQPHFLGSDGNLEVYRIEKADQINESDDFGDFTWVQEIEADLEPGRIYDIKTGNGYYWVPEIYVGRGWDDEYQMEFHKFKDIDGGGSGRKSIPYVKDLIEKGEIRPYDPNWTIKDDLTFSNNIEDALKGNFVIYFKDGVYLDQTLAIQDKLFEMGFSFYTKGPNEYITTKDSPDKIQFFECFNWDTSNPRYSSMPSNQWDLKKILLVKVKDDDFTWSRRPNPRIEEQELFLTVSNHDAIVINGDNYITNGINESEEKWTQWIEDVEPNFNATTLRYGQKFKNKWGEYIRTVMFVGQDDEEVSYETPMTLLYFKIIDDPSGYRPYPHFPKDHEFNSELTLNPKKFDEGLKSGRYVPMFTDEEFKLKESKDLDWIRQQKPEKKLNKNKSYVIDVTNLRPTPMRHSHDTSLTRQDILRRFKDLGYNVEDIDVDEAKYFYIEPNQGSGWQYNEYGTPIDYDYWVDYNSEYMSDPSYGGKYQMIDIDELMFLLDNNLISESDESMSWLTTSMGEPMTICEAQSELKAGDTIMISELPDYDKLDVGSRGKILENTTALVLDVDRCNKIQPDNMSSLMTILIHVNDDYVGFDDSWLESFANEEHKKICSDGRCMFLVCGESYGEVDIKITKLNTSFLGESKKQINEVAGISFESREWADIIYDEIMSNPEEKTRLTIDGYDYPEAFDKFPIDYVVIDYYDKITGYGQDYSGYDNDGNYIVHLYVQPKLVMGQGGYTLKSALNHEMRHAWEDYNRRSKGLPSIDDTKESKELYTRDFIHLMSDDKVVGPIKDILKYFYYLSKLETGPYMENVYDQNPAYESLVRDIATKDFESFKDRFDLELNWHLINTNYDIPFTKKFKSATDFIDYSSKELRKRTNKVIKKINKVKYVHGKL